MHLTYCSLTHCEYLCLVCGLSVCFLNVFLKKSSLWLSWDPIHEIFNDYHFCVHLKTDHPKVMTTFPCVYGDISWFHAGLFRMWLIWLTYSKGLLSLLHGFLTPPAPLVEKTVIPPTLTTAITCVSICLWTSCSVPSVCLSILAPMPLSLL